MNLSNWHNNRIMRYEVLSASMYNEAKSLQFHPAQALERKTPLSAIAIADWVQASTGWTRVRANDYVVEQSVPVGEADSIVDLSVEVVMVVAVVAVASTGKRELSKLHFCRASPTQVALARLAALPQDYGELVHNCSRAAHLGFAFFYSKISQCNHPRCSLQPRHRLQRLAKM